MTNRDDENADLRRAVTALLGELLDIDLSDADERRSFRRALEWAAAERKRREDRAGQTMGEIVKAVISAAVGGVSMWFFQHLGNAK